MMPFPSALNRISIRNLSTPLTRRRTSMESQKQIPDIAERAILSGRGAQARRRMLKLVVAWLVIVFLAVKFFSHTASKPPAYVDDEMHVAPYTTQRPSYVRPAAEWLADRMYDARQNVDQRVKISKLVPSSFRKHIGLGKSTTRHGSPPHQALVFPSFQARMYKLTAPDWRSYEAKLTKFARDAFPKRLAQWSIAETKRIRRKSNFNPIPLRVWQTGRALPKNARTFVDMNRRASYNFYTDPLLEKWATEHFNRSQIKHVWDGMERVVLKTDFWRYLVMYLEGGFYSDLDTDCLQPVHHWGQVDVVKWDLGPSLTPQAVLDAPPQVVVGIEVDVPDITGWETFWPRPIQIVQWTMAGAPGHPIYLDAIRRVVESMERIKEWDKDRKDEARKILADLADDSDVGPGRPGRRRSQKKGALEHVEKLLAVDPFDREGGGVMSLIEATGPGAFSDAVFSYLQARFGVHWSQLHNIQTATRIGDVAILPITGFAPFQRPDWQRWKGIDRGPMAVVGDVTHPQAMVYHHFSGSWRTKTDNSA